MFDSLPCAIFTIAFIGNQSYWIFKLLKADRHIFELEKLNRDLRMELIKRDYPEFSKSVSKKD